MKARNIIATNLFMLGMYISASAQTQPTEPTAQELADQYQALANSILSGDNAGAVMETPGPIISITSGHLQDQTRWRGKVGAILDQANEHEAKLRAEIASDTDSEKKLNAQLESLVARPGITEDSLAPKVDDLQKQLDALEFERVGADARQSAIEDAIARLSKKAEAAGAADPVAAQLNDVVDVRRHQLAALEDAQSKGLSSPEQISSARADLADAIAKLAVTKEQAAAAAGGNEIASLNHDLLELVIANRERMAKISFVRDRLNEARQELTIADEILQYDARKTQAQTELDGYESVLRAARQSYANLSEKPDGPSTAP